MRIELKKGELCLAREREREIMLQNLHFGCERRGAEREGRVGVMKILGVSKPWRHSYGDYKGIEIFAEKKNKREKTELAYSSITMLERERWINGTTIAHKYST